MTPVELDNKNQDEVNELRLSAYQNTQGFKASPPAILWNQSDDQSRVFGIRSDHGQLVATMRLEIHTSLEDAEAKIEAPLPANIKPAIAPPIGLLSRAATAPGWEAMGLNGRLRLEAFKCATRLNMGWIVGTLVKGAPRANTLLELGYELYDHPYGWTSAHYRSLSDVQIAVLNLKKRGARARALLEERQRGVA